MLKWLILSAFLISSCSIFSNKNKEKADLYHRVALSSIENRQYPQALAALQNAESLDPNNAAIQNSLGLVYFVRGKYDISEKKFRQAIAISPDFTDARNNLSRNLVELGKYKEAEKEARTVLSDLTYNTPEKAYINLGLSKFNQNQFNDSYVFFQKAIESSPDNCVAQTYAGRSLFESKRYSEAAFVLDKAIGFCQKSMDDEPNYYSALAYYRAGDKTKSIARFEELVKLYPDGKHRQKSAGMLSLIRGEQDETHR